MPRKQTSDRLSALSGSYIKITRNQLEQRLAESPRKTIADIHSLAASVKSQDEKRGKRRAGTQRT